MILMIRLDKNLTLRLVKQQSEASPSHQFNALGISLINEKIDKESELS